MTDSKTARFKFFLPSARLLQKDEISNLPPEKIEAAKAAGAEGLWLEIACPDESCIGKDGNISIPAKGVETSEKKGVFLNLFCPEDSCEIVHATDLP